MSHKGCCVVSCKNTGIKSARHFYKFPTASWKINQRKKWIAAVRRQNIDGSLWTPKAHDCICSDHFIGGQKSDIELSPSYIPTKFPTVYKSQKVNELMVTNRFKRLMDRWQNKNASSALNPEPEVNELQEMITEDSPTVTDLRVDQECQVNFHSESDVNLHTFICNRYVKNEICHAETQTEIIDDTRSIKVKINKKKCISKKCGTPHTTFVNQQTQSDITQFIGFSSIKNNNELIDLAGVSFENFEFLLRRVSSSKKGVVSTKDRLLIFLMKMKTGLTFSALGVLFSVHRTTVSRIFFEILQKLAGATRNLVFWPDIDAVQETMPDCFRPEYSDTRVIIDCTEFRIEIPSSVDNRVFTYSQYKKNFTAKVLIGITPGGFISLKSKVAGGRKSDSQLTIESGLLDLLEDGDKVLADKGFPEIKTVIDTSGKKVNIIMPPFLEKKNEFSKAETLETYSVARVRIHVERIMQRLKTYQILNKIPENLLHCIDDILHICCVLVNLQPPILSNKEDKEGGN